MTTGEFAWEVRPEDDDKGKKKNQEKFQQLKERYDIIKRELNKYKWLEKNEGDSG